MNQEVIDRLFRGTGNVKLRSIRAGVVDELALMDRAKEGFRINRSGGTELPEHLQINRSVDSFADRYRAAQAAQREATKRAKRSGQSVAQVSSTTKLMSQDVLRDSPQTMDMFKSGQNDGRMMESVQPRYKTGTIVKQQKGTTPVAVRSPEDIFEVSRQIQDGGHNVTTMCSALYPHMKPLADEPRALGAKGPMQSGLSREMKMWDDPSFTAVNCALPQRAKPGVSADAVRNQKTRGFNTCHNTDFLINSYHRL